MLANAKHEVVVYGKLPARRPGFDGYFERIPAVAIQEDPIVPLDGPAAVVHVAEELLPSDKAFGVDPAAEPAIERKNARLEKQLAGVSVVQGQAGLGSGGCPVAILVARGQIEPVMRNVPQLGPDTRGLEVEPVVDSGIDCRLRD